MTNTIERDLVGRARVRHIPATLEQWIVFEFVLAFVTGLGICAYLAMGHTTNTSIFVSVEASPASKATSLKNYAIVVTLADAVNFCLVLWAATASCPIFTEGESGKALKASLFIVANPTIINASTAKYS